MGKKVVRVVDERFLGLSEVRRLLKRSFPLEERVAFPLLLLRSKAKDFEILAYYDGGTLCGVSVTCQNSTVCALMYLAVSEKLRDEGVGSAILRYLENRHRGKIIIADVEVPVANASNIEQRIKRSRFYEKNGYTSSGYGYTFGRTDFFIVSKNVPLNELLIKDIYNQMFFGLFCPDIHEIGC